MSLFRCGGGVAVNFPPSITRMQFNALSVKNGVTINVNFKPQYIICAICGMSGSTYGYTTYGSRDGDIGFYSDNGNSKAPLSIAFGDTSVTLNLYGCVSGQSSNTFAFIYVY